MITTSSTCAPLERESGIAMLTAVMVCTIVMMLGITAVALSDHTLGTQRVDRKRVATFHSAEAGIDRALQVLKTTAHGSLPCASPLATSLGSGLGAADFSVAFQYFDSGGTPMGCPLASSPTSVLLTSIGDSSDPVGSQRELQVAARFAPPSTITGFDKVIFSDSGISFGQNVDIDGYVGNDAVVYTNGDYDCSQSQQLVGAVYAQGSATLANLCGVEGDVWANDAVVLSGNATVGRDVTSTNSTVSISTNATVRRNVRAASTITNLGTVLGLLIPNSPPWTGAPQSAMPEVPYDESAWVTAGYTIRSYTDCALAETELKTLASTWTAPTLLHITGCQLIVNNNSTITLSHHLAIVSDWGMKFNNNTLFQTATPGEIELHLIVPWGSTCASPSQGNIEFGQRFEIRQPIRTFAYSPCTVKLQNAGLLKGQFYAETLEFVNRTNIAYRPVSGVPGYAPITSTNEVRQVWVQYRREVSTP